MPVKSLIGKKFGRLTIKERAGSIRSYATWLAFCDCGNVLVVPSARFRKKNHDRRDEHSCGCAQKDRINWLQEIAAYDGDDCIRWPFSYSKSGYAYAGRPAHRMLCAIVNGEPDAEQLATHTCGNGAKGCLNPRHLKWGTHLENMRDKWRHGTMMMGEGHYEAKLTVDQVISIKASSDPQLTLAQRYGVSRPTISGIKNGRTWKSVGNRAFCAEHRHLGEADDQRP